MRKKIQLIVSIDKEVYKAIKSPLDCGGHYDSKCYDAIWNGVPLPEGHGRLIDANELKKVYDERISYLYKLNKKDNPSRESRICATNWCNNMIDELPTIIESEGV